MKHLKKTLLCLAFGFLVMSSKVFTEIRDVGDYIRCSLCIGYGAFVVSEWVRTEREIREMKGEIGTEGRKKER